MRKQFSLDNLDPVVFEKYCYDLLSEMGFFDIDWRKGTGEGSSSSDSGRDLECKYASTDPDGSIIIQKWYVECKHHKKGIPATAINNALTWSASGRPDVLLLIASNHFSNPTKDHLKEYRNENKPPFRIKTWERPELEKNSRNKLLLLKKYGLEDATETLDLMHPAHLSFISDTHLNRLETLFKLLEELKPKDRDDITGWLWELIIRPSRRKPERGDETMGELLVDPVNYAVFKEKCFEISEYFDGILLCGFIVNFLLQELFAQGDLTSIDSRVENQRHGTELFRQIYENDPRTHKFESVEDAVKRYTSHVEAIPQRTARWHELYITFCERIVVKLLEEDVLSPPSS